jgi:hypothetical protein
MTTDRLFTLTTDRLTTDQQLTPDLATITPELPQYIDSTMISCFRSCPQKFYNEFILGLRPKATSIDLHAGAAFATARESFNKNFHKEKVDFSHLVDHTHACKARAFADFQTYWGDVEAPPKHPKTRENTWLAFERYLESFPPSTDHVQPYFAEGVPTFEFTFAIPLDDTFPPHPETNEPFIYAGRFDMLGSYHTRPCVLDDKTTRSAGDKWAEQWSLRGPFMGYVWACQREGIPLDTVVIRGVVIQKTDIRILEAIKVFPPHLIDRWYAQLRQDILRLVKFWRNHQTVASANPIRAHEEFEYNFAEACSAYGNCAFMPLCLTQSKNRASWLESYTVRRWNPVMKDPIRV